MQAELINLPLEILTALGVGYFGYITAFAGMRRGHSPQDAVFLSLAFSAVSLLGYRVIGVFLGASITEYGQALSVLVSVLLTLIFSILFRKYFRRWWYFLLNKMNVHLDDGIYGVWNAILQIPDLGISQLSVHTKDGRVLYMQQRPPYAKAPFDGLLLGSDGSVSMIVEKERMPDGTEKKSGGIVDELDGTRITYIPADQILRVNIRIK